MKRWIVPFIEGIIFVALIGVGICNAVKNGQFWNASFAQLATPLIALSIAFWATQYKNDQRKAKEHAERIIVKLQEIVGNERFYSISTASEPKEINAVNRKINNYISVLKDYSKPLRFEKEITYIETEFNKYKQTVGDHISDLDYLSKTESEFRKIADNIDSKCEAVIIKLYK